MELGSLDHFKSVTAYQFFVRPADQNYLLARWMLANSFYPEFFWQASQAIEKYLKAGLLLNDTSVAKYGHELGALYKKHRDVLGDLAFTTFTKPEKLSKRYWHDEEVEVFLVRMHRCGDPDSRYGLTSWWRREDDLFKLDQSTFAFRRLAVRLNMIGDVSHLTRKKRTGLRGLIYKEILERESRFQPWGKFGDLDCRVPLAGETRADFLHSWNFEFLRRSGDLKKPAPGSVAHNGMQFSNSYMYLYWEQLQKDGPVDPILRQGIGWLVKNVKLSKEAVTEIKDRMAQRS